MTCLLNLWVIICVVAISQRQNYYQDPDEQRLLLIVSREMHAN